MSNKQQKSFGRGHLLLVVTAILIAVAFIRLIIIAIDQSGNEPIKSFAQYPPVPDEPTVFIQSSTKDNCSPYSPVFSDPDEEAKRDSIEQMLFTFSYPSNHPAFKEFNTAQRGRLWQDLSCYNYETTQVEILYAAVHQDDETVGWDLEDAEREMEEQNQYLRDVEIKLAQLDNSEIAFFDFTGWHFEKFKELVCYVPHNNLTWNFDIEIARAEYERRESGKECMALHDRIEKDFEEAGLKMWREIFPEFYR